MKATVSQTRLQNTQAVVKMEPKSRIKLRKLKIEKTIAPYRIGMTVKLNLVPEQDWHR